MLWNILIWCLQLYSIEKTSLSYNFINVNRDLFSKLLLLTCLYFVVLDVTNFPAMSLCISNEKNYVTLTIMLLWKSNMTVWHLQTKISKYYSYLIKMLFIYYRKEFIVCMRSSFMTQSCPRFMDCINSSKSNLLDIC